MEYGLIGEKLGHSFSKEIHEKIENYEYVLREIKKEDLDSFMKAKDFKAINVTIPYKEEVIKYLDDISECAREIGAVNVIVNSGGKLCGDNTDFYGMKSLIEKAKADVLEKKVLILGNGGTSKTAYAVVKSMGARQILKVSRKNSADTVTYDRMYEEHTDAQIIINTTPVGMYPETEMIPVNLNPFKNLEGVIDAIYNPLCTKLVLEGRKRGIRAEGGLFMLCSQAVFAAEKFTGKVYPDGMTQRVYSQIFPKKQNIVLTGMPSSGKSTVGKLLSKELGLEFLDVDTMIEKKYSMTIPEIFSLKGEAVFRRMETECIREISRKSGCVIATGGGAILKEENVDFLKMNSRVYFLDRDIKYLTPTSDRPLASDVDAVKKRYEERYSIYIDTADEIVENNDSAQSCAKKIAQLHSKSI